MYDAIDPISLDDRLSLSVTAEIGEAVRSAAAARGLTVADYVRGATMARLTLDGARFRPLPNLQRLAARAGRARTL